MSLSYDDIKQLEERIIDVLRTVYDPEIPVDIYELGLIYEVKVDADGKADVLMTLTSPSCPVAESLPLEVEEKVRGVKGVTEGKVTHMLASMGAGGTISGTAK